MKYYFDTKKNFPIEQDDEFQNIYGLVEIQEDEYLKLMAVSASEIIVTDNELPHIIPAKSYYYSAADNAFYPAEMQTSYKASGTWPEHGLWVMESVFIEFSLSSSPPGKTRIAGADGMPEWGALPEPTKEQLISDAEYLKQSRLMTANTVIVPLQDAVDLAMETEREAIALKSWKKYRVELSRVDVSAAPDIEWPAVPDDVA